MHELRILNGLHRGATLPLDETSHMIGASEDADVVLVDQGIEQRHATLTRTDSGWLLSAGDGSVYTADSNQPQTVVDLAAGDFARIGDIWLTVALEDAPWEKPPPEPAPVIFDESNDASEEPPPEIDHLADDTSDSVPEHFAGDGEDQPVKSPSRWRLMRVPVFVIAALCAAGVYALASSGSSTSVAPMAADADLGIKSPSATKTGQDAASAFPEEQGAVLAEEELRVLFRKRLASADLLNRFDLKLGNRNWSMRATLDAEETARFERILRAFIAKYKITFPVQATVGSGEAMLPFKIRQVISGENASVVTDEGHRLYVGDQYRGVHVVAIQDSRLTFLGKRKIEVNW